MQFAPAGEVFPSTGGVANNRPPPAKSSAKPELAEKAIHQRLRVLPIAHSKEHRELKDALNSLTVLKRML
jgi:hypothetical protein